MTIQRECKLAVNVQIKLNSNYCIITAMCEYLKKCSYLKAAAPAALRTHGRHGWNV